MFFIVSIVSLLPLSAGADTPELITDRPDFTESSAAVAPGYVQAELGLEGSLTHARKDLVLPALLLRVGIAENVELRLGAPSMALTWNDLDLMTEAEPLELGAKLVLPGEGAGVGLLPYVTLPVRSGQFDEGGAGAGAGIKGVWSVDLHGRLALAGNIGLEISGLGAPDGITWEGSGSLSLGITITDKLGTFVESYLLYDADEVRPYGMTGLTYLAVSWLQLDLYGGMLLSSPTTGIMGAGLSLLL